MLDPALKKVTRLYPWRLIILFSLVVGIFSLVLVLFLLYFTRVEKTLLELSARPLQIEGRFLAASPADRQKLRKFISQLGLGEDLANGFKIPVDSSTSARLASFGHRRISLEFLDDKSLFFAEGQISSEPGTLFENAAKAPEGTVAYLAGQRVGDFLSGLFPNWPPLFRNYLSDSFGSNFPIFLVQNKDQVDLVAVASKNEELSKKSLESLSKLSQELLSEASYKDLVGSSFKLSKVENIPVYSIALPLSYEEKRFQFKQFSLAYFADHLILVSSEETLPLVFSSLRGEQRTFLEKTHKVRETIAGSGSLLFVSLTPSKLVAGSLPSPFITLAGENNPFLGALDRIELVALVLKDSGFQGLIELKN